MNAPDKVIPIQPAGDDGTVSLYEVRRRIHPRAVTGWFAAWRWGLVALTQVVFYGLPWLEWSGRQAVLFDLGARKFYIGGLVFWPQDVIYLTVLLLVAAYSLFLFTAVAGRLWCGYACPQTVYTEMFMWVERRIEGDRVARIRLDAAPMGAAKVAKKAAKHGIWIALALWTGFTFVGYFTPIRELVPAIPFGLGGWSAFWILFYGFATYGNAGWMREQVCKYMCPYARFQSAMFDPDTLIIAYDRERGEPRGAGSRSQDRKAKGLGDCVDCGLCVQVCPTGIDIRNGLQYECIGCAACIDACNYVMDKVGLPRGLIRYSTEQALEKHYAAATIWKRVFRPRVLVYGSILAAVTAGLVVALVLRVPLKVDVIRDRGSLAREVETGWIENAYRLQVMNTSERVRVYAVRAEGLPGLTVASQTSFEVPAATTTSVPLRLQAPPAEVAPGSHRVYIEITAQDDASIHVREKTTFLGLRR
ncbi:MAG: ferredoxin [Betaproteobacteria bacterium]|nr:MAG: ferredoxin [Betaproteobacteria bacterium]